MLADIVNQLRQYVNGVTKEVGGIPTQYDLIGRFESHPHEIEDFTTPTPRIEKKRCIQYTGSIIASQDTWPEGFAHDFNGKDIVDQVRKMAQKLTKGKYEIQTPPQEHIDICIATHNISPKEARSEEAAIRRNFKDELSINTTFDYSDWLLEELLGEDI